MKRRTANTNCTQDPNWAIADTIELRTAGLEMAAHCLGVITAWRNATGWFIAAKYRQGLPDAEVQHFRHFVATRVYLLLRYGPQLTVWKKADAECAWQAWSYAIVLDTVLEVPDTVPAHW